MMQVVNRPQMTLGEFSGWKEQELKLMAPNLVRLQTQGLAQWVWRRFRILQRAGQIAPIPLELTRRRLTVEFESPLARVQRFANARSVLQAHQGLEQLAVTDPSVRDIWNNDVAGKIVVSAFTDVPDLIYDPQKVAEIRQARAQLQQQQRQLEQTAQAVETAAVASHAIQAKTLADQRRPAA
jgi:hypothetical protein